jgi:hypothetical protein
MHQHKLIRSMRPNAFPWLPCAFLALLLLVASALAEPGAPGRRSYQNGYPTMVKIAAELHQALDKSKSRHVGAQTLLLDEESLEFCVGPARGGTPGVPDPVVQISAGCVALLNGISHAKAIDEAQPGHFKHYAAALARSTTGVPAPAAQNVSEAQASDFDTMNHQASTFNQMAGALIAIDFAHHYLGHYRKHGAKLADATGKPVPINSCLTEREWRAAVVTGARNALDCGLGVDGLRSLLAVFDQMPARPDWAGWFIHPKANVSKLDRELEALERDFFLVEK